MVYCGLGDNKADIHYWDQRRCVGFEDRCVDRNKDRFHKAVAC